MSALKNKLAHKVEVLSSDDITKDNIEVDGIPSKTSEQQNKLIVFKNNDDSISSITADFAISIAKAKERIDLLQSFVKEMMVPNIDYGLIPGCQKPSLYKSGAEKLCDIFGFSKQLEISNRIEDWGKGIFAYEIKCILINKRTDLIEAEGIGSCNNREKKYKNQDSFTICNTILKMAKKRALIDAVLSATRSSGIFTQDVEDLEMESSKVNPPTEITIKEVYALVKSLNMSTAYMKKILDERYNVKSSTELSSAQVQDLYNFLKKSSNN